MRSACAVFVLGFQPGRLQADSRRMGLLSLSSGVIHSALARTSTTPCDLHKGGRQVQSETTALPESAVWDSDCRRIGPPGGGRPNAISRASIPEKNRLEAGGFEAIGKLKREPLWRTGPDAKPADDSTPCQDDAEDAQGNIHRLGHRRNLQPPTRHCALRATGRVGNEQRPRTVRVGRVEQAQRIAAALPGCRV